MGSNRWRNQTSQQTVARQWDSSCRISGYFYWCWRSFFLSSHLWFHTNQVKRHANSKASKSRDKDLNESRTDFKIKNRYLHYKWLITLGCLLMCFYSEGELNCFCIPYFAYYSKMKLSKSTGHQSWSFRGLSILRATKTSKECFIFTLLLWRLAVVSSLLQDWSLTFELF